MAYEPIGSSAGLRKIRANEADFGASDVAPPASELAKDGLVMFPTAITGVVPVINLANVGDGQLRLSGDVLARIFLGEIRRWNDAEVAQLNRGVSLADMPIKVVVRSDGSGTTYNFADYLAKVSQAWKGRFGTSFPWPQGFAAVKGSDGVVKAVKEAPGAIGYVDFGYVIDNKLKAVQVENLEGEFVKPTTNAFRQALANSEWFSQGTFTATLTNKPGKGTWPITMGTFIAVPQVAERPEQTQRALRFFVWAFTRGDQLVQASNFVRLPDRVQAAAFRVIASVKDKDGNLIGMSLPDTPSQMR